MGCASLTQLPASAGKGVAATPTIARIGKIARPAELETRPGVLSERNSEITTAPASLHATPDAPRALPAGSRGEPTPELRADIPPGVEAALCSVFSLMTGPVSLRDRASFGDTHAGILSIYSLTGLTDATLCNPTNTGAWR